MNADNYIKIIKDYLPKMSIKTYFCELILSGIFLFVSLIFRLASDSVVIKWIFVAMLAFISVTVVIIVAFSSFGKITIKKDLIISSCGSINVLIQSLGSITITCGHTFGWSYLLLLFYLPVFLVMFFYISSESKITKGVKPYPTAENVTGSAMMIGLGSTLGGVAIARLLRLFLDDKSEIIVLIVLLVAMSSILTLCNTPIIRLYYYIKFEKAGLISEELFHAK